MTKKMIRNYVPFVKIENPSDKRRGPHKKDPVAVRKTAIKLASTLAQRLSLKEKEE